MTMDALRNRIADLCPDKRPVFGQGPVPCPLVLIGEAPGGEEEKQGLPFVGSAGKELSRFLEVLGLERENFYLTNTVKIRPTSENPKTGRLRNRTPNAKELAAYTPLLHEELALVQPKMIVTLGNTPLRAVTGDKKIVIGDCHGRLMEGGIFPLYHPAAIIYNRSLRTVYEADVLALKELLKGGGIL